MAALRGTFVHVKLSRNPAPGPRLMLVQNTDRQFLQPREYPKLLSIVVPMYNEESVIASLRSALTRFMSELREEAEVILVNDGSKDSTLGQIVEWAHEDPRVRVIDLSRNFGHQNAATA